MEELPVIRCYTCNKVIGALWFQYKEMIANGIRPGKALDDLDLKRVCCRSRMLNPAKTISHVEHQEIGKPTEYRSIIELATHRHQNKISSESSLYMMQEDPNALIQPIDNTSISLFNVPTLPSSNTSSLPVPNFNNMDNMGNVSIQPANQFNNPVNLKMLNQQSQIQSQKNSKRKIIRKYKAR